MTVGSRFQSRGADNSTDEPFAPSRLVIARRRRGYTQRQLASVVGLTAQSLSNAEKGRQIPEVENLRRIATVLDFPLDFFLGDELEEVPATAISFRARAKTSARVQEAARSAGTLAVEVNRWLEKNFALPAADLPSYERPSPEMAAEMVRRAWGLGDAPIVNMVHLLEAHGVRVFSLAKDYETVDALSFWRDNLPVVFLNTGKTAERSRFDAAHELGHLVLHRGEHTPESPNAEKEANAFASAFLMPLRTVIAAGYLSTPQDILRAKKPLKVSALALIYRLHDLELLSDWRRRDLLIQLTQIGYRSAEPGGIERETSQLLTKVFDALKSEPASVRSLARAVRISLRELSSMTFGIVPVSLQGGGQRTGTREGRLTLVESSKLF
jgi:Zn-dependent peptidase ImmA (M78 family)/DNA-binding XRE family transcriptional regulator